jgi:hypothetical protein
MARQTTLYRYLTGPDDASFCHRVSEALSRGWVRESRIVSGRNGLKRESVSQLNIGSMMLSENRFALFGIMLSGTRP